MITGWPAPSTGQEYALALDRGRSPRLLVLPALFDEANKLRHFTVEVMRRLDAAGIDTFLPDLPGCNESTTALEVQSLAGWREAAWAAADHFKAQRVLAIRGGGLTVPEALPGWRYGPVSGASLLRGLLRARVIAAREAALDESREQLLLLGRSQGLELAGFHLGPQMIGDLEQATTDGTALADVPPDRVGGPGLWLRAEPGHNAAQADALAAFIAAAFLA